jgi:hypothetical protein
MFLWLIVFDGPGEEYVGWWPDKCVVVARDLEGARVLARENHIPRPSVKSCSPLGVAGGSLVLGLGYSRDAAILCTEGHEVR